MEGASVLTLLQPVMIQCAWYGLLKAIFAIATK
jgi:hypothetical protein